MPEWLILIIGGTIFSVICWLRITGFQIANRNDKIEKARFYKNSALVEYENAQKNVDKELRRRALRVYIFGSVVLLLLVVVLLMFSER